MHWKNKPKKINQNNIIPNNNYDSHSTSPAPLGAGRGEAKQKRPGNTGTFLLHKFCYTNHLRQLIVTAHIKAPTFKMHLYNYQVPIENFRKQISLTFQTGDIMLLNFEIMKNSFYYQHLLLCNQHTGF